MNQYATMFHINESALGVGHSYTEEDIPKLKAKIEEEIKRSEACEERNYDKMQYSNPYSKEIHRLVTIIEFLEQGVKVERTGGGLITVNNKFIVSLANPKWRVKGKNKWYWYKDPAQFVSKYINREDRK